MHEYDLLAPERLRDLLRDGRIVVRGLIDKDHPTDVDLVVIATNGEGTRAGLAVCTWGLAAEPELTRGNADRELPSSIIDLTNDGCLPLLDELIESLGQVDRLWTLDEDALWVLRSKDTVVRTCDIQPAASAFALSHLAVIRVAAAKSIREPRSSERGSHWQDILVSLGQRLRTLHEG
jgi:hypothetical protein